LEQARVAPGDPACERFEPHFDERECARCGACCREGFDVVTVGADELLRHPKLVSASSLGRVLARPGGRCVALSGGQGTAFRCSIYPERPRSCREFEVSGDACLLARRRVGLSL
jgi:Fe-S-cluster containining protein